MRNDTAGKGRPRRYPVRASEGRAQGAPVKGGSVSEARRAPCVSSKLKQHGFKLCLSCLAAAEVLLLASWSARDDDDDQFFFNVAVDVPDLFVAMQTLPVRTLDCSP